jgi:transposase
MHNQETHDLFILLRAQGMSFNDISVNLNVSQSTLILWSRQHRLDCRIGLTAKMCAVQKKRKRRKNVSLLYTFAPYPLLSNV